MERSGWGFWPLTLLTQCESSLCLLAVFELIKRLYQISSLSHLRQTPGDLRNKRSVLLAHNPVASLPSYYPTTCLLFHVPRDRALGQGWQNSVIILTLAPAHALPLIHFTASLLAPEGEVDNVGEKERAIGWEVSSSVISQFFPFSLPTSPPIYMLPHGLLKCMMPLLALLLALKEAESEKELGCCKRKRRISSPSS